MLYNISIIGCGYIGIVIGACLADFGNKVSMADIDIKKIDNLKNGTVNIYEPGLEELIKKNLKQNRLDFTTNISQSIKNSDLIFIAVNTPTDKNGIADISAVKNVASIIGDNINNDKIICIKSTVPIDTHKLIESIIKEKNKTNHNFTIVSIPEFLREGTAIKDFINPDRIIIGTKSEKIFLVLKDIFSKTKCKSTNIIWTDNSSAETIKYASNSFLALKISFMNEMANFCDKIGVDALTVSKGIGMDKRIGNQFLKPGPGFGGSCFPKDIFALNKTANDLGIELKTIKATIEINEQQKICVVNKLKKLLNNELSNKTIAILGLAFKPNTDDIRYSPAIDIIKYLLEENTIVKAYDPKAAENMKNEIQNIIYCNSVYECIKNSDAIVLLTDWQEFKKLDFEKIYSLVNKPIVLDTRNILDIENLKKLNFKVDTIGRSVKTN